MSHPRKTPTEQPISIELLPTPDRTSVVVLLRSNEPIPMGALCDTLAKFSDMLMERFVKKNSGIVTPPSIIQP